MKCSKIVKALVCSLSLMIIFRTAQAQHYTAKSYLHEYTPVAQQLMKESGIPASIILGVAMLESGMGNSKNARLLHNHFGIVGRNELHKKGTYHSKYKEYANATASYNSFVKTLQRKKWFRSMKGTSDYTLWLKHMHAGKYSAAGNVWVTRVTAIITRYKLHALDADMTLVKE
ncbi:Flagellum-specific peptidoglycan hydrolase FlgJ [Chitinophaga costaii]|uniref:Flagellum-specific peptidoglycan hydrolase FlgJ n=1 Tax=Chitinophaga costaii TaxID=1335309 RepID=A0A1C4F4N9_9BACT|nr:glucosaminidase domain-containing protein [Chitinophaga costaii]PUZ22065.1 muramidase [Chitinophaga costaii]SCC50824.1 Flagellum-specific peptidoglycan hydrolase FlgJ [Chitinophaga costaii]